MTAYQERVAQRIEFHKYLRAILYNIQAKYPDLVFFSVKITGRQIQFALLFKDGEFTHIAPVEWMQGKEYAHAHQDLLRCVQTANSMVKMGFYSFDEWQRAA